MREIHEPNWEALTAYLLSEQSKQQGEEVRRWLAESPDHQAIFDNLRLALRDGPAVSAELRARTWASIQRGMAHDSGMAGGTRPDAQRIHSWTSRGPVWRSRLAWSAVACVAVLAAGAVLFATSRRPSANDVAVSRSPAVQEVSTRSGRNAIVRLPDGSTVVLGVASRLRYATTFASTERDVYLDGQAYFTVTHASGWPFVVHAGKVTARVLGTRFSVRKYATDTVARVVVAQGRVTVRHAVLKAGDAMEAWSNGASTITHGVDVSRELAWTDAGLQFEGTPLSDAIPQLERAFAIKISVGDSTLLAEPITISLEDEKSHDALQIIATITHSRAVWSRNHVVLLRP